MHSILVSLILAQGPPSAPGAIGGGQARDGVVLTQPAVTDSSTRRLFGRLRAPKASVPPSPVSSTRRAAPADPPVRRTQTTPDDLPAIPGASAPIVPVPTVAVPTAGGQPITMEAALYGAITSNPDLVALRQGNAASAEAVEVARRFPTTLNPTLWVDVRPLAYERVPGMTLGNGGRIPPKLDQKDALMFFSLRQPIELGHQTRSRYHIAKAAYSQQQWTVVQAELLSLVQTYRFFQTAAYRREKLRVAIQLAEFNDKLVQTLKRRLEAVNQVQAADVALAEVEAEGTRQLVEAARQDYAVALADLQNQIGLPETAGTAEPLGDFALAGAIPEVEDAELVQLALHNRPDLHGARAAAQGARAAVCLAKGDRIPTPVVGPIYERDEQGTQFFGFVYITPIPILNSGMPLVRQREAEYQRALVAARQLEQRAIAQVRSAVAKWNGANRLVSRTAGLPEAVRGQIATLEQLFDVGQTDLSRLLQARRSLIQLENARLDAMWQATQAQADLLTAVGSPSMIAALQTMPRPVQASSASSAPSTPPPVVRASAPAGR
ncbi:MAG: outer membrane protein [Planctomycetota bacterium]|nr:outer membrane protein [Planctomycetota bacterium]